MVVHFSSTKIAHNTDEVANLYASVAIGQKSAETRQQLFSTVAQSVHTNMLNV